MRLITDRTFWLKVERAETGCWLWQGKKDGRGYGDLRRVPSRTERSAHRFAYRLVKGAIPVGLQLDHLCRTPACVNPDHLEPVTSRENTLRGNTIAARYAGRQACNAGHPFDEANTSRASGSRQCRACSRIRAATKRAAARQAYPEQARVAA